MLPGSGSSQKMPKTIAFGPASTLTWVCAVGGAPWTGSTIVRSAIDSAVAHAASSSLPSTRSPSVSIPARSDGRGRSSTAAWMPMAARNSADENSMQPPPAWLRHLFVGGEGHAGGLAFRAHPHVDDAERGSVRRKHVGQHLRDLAALLVDDLVDPVVDDPDRAG